MHKPDELNRLAAKWCGENGDYAEAKRDCADELEAVLAAQSAHPSSAQEPQ